MHRESVRIRGAEGDYKWSIKRKGLPEEAAALVVWLLCDASSYITGTTQVSQNKMFRNKREQLTVIDYRRRLYLLIDEPVVESKERNLSVRIV